MTNYRCTLTPLGEYFFGGEKTFERKDADGENVRRGKSPYFIHSQLFPSQASVMGVLRYLVLEKNNMLNHTADETTDLIGSRGFDISNLDETKTYGKIDSIGPVYLSDGICSYLRTPLNHVNGPEDNPNTCYKPFQMSGTFCSNISDNTYLPLDFVAKNGTADSLICIRDNCLDDLCIINTSKVFKTEVHTRTNKSQSEDAFFKKEYVVLKHQMRFTFDVMAELECLPVKDIVHIGQEKSAFLFECTECAEKKFNISTPQNTPVDVCVYYLLSDSYLGDFSKSCVYWCSESSGIRTINNSHDRSAVRSSRRTLYSRGSVFYVKRDKICDFEKNVNVPAMQKAGYNKYIRMGE